MHERAVRRLAEQRVRRGHDELHAGDDDEQRDERAHVAVEVDVRQHRDDRAHKDCRRRDHVIAAVVRGREHGSERIIRPTLR